MSPIDLNLVRVFVAASEEGSFTAAGERLSVPRSTVSRSVAALEVALGVTLFRRTTRSVATTEAGAALYKRVSTSFASLEASLSDVSASEEQPNGVVRVATTADLGVVLLPSAIARYTTRYPNVQVDVNWASELVEVASGGFDLALRVSNAPLAGAAAVAQRVGRVRLQLYASSTYLSRCGAPHTLGELLEHDWISIHNNRLPIPLQGRVRHRTNCGDSFMVRELLRNGAGIGVLPTHMADVDVDTGLLVQVLPQWFELTGTIYLLCAPRESISREALLLRDLIVEQACHGGRGLSSLAV